MIRIATGQEVLILGINMDRGQVLEVFICIQCRAPGLICALVVAITESYASIIIVGMIWARHSIHVIQLDDSIVRPCDEL